MRTKPVFAAMCLIAALTPPVHAEESSAHAAHGAHADMAAEHGGGIFHMFRLEVDAGRNTDGISIQNWDMDGWIGTDENKLWLKSEGERANNELESAEFWALYSRNVSMFWDAQVGVRYDSQPESTTYLTFGVNGLAPYWFETEAHFFISQHGDVTARLRLENDVFLTQRLVAQPYAEINFSAQDVEEYDLGTGVTDGEIGLQMRYEITRQFAPYVDVYWDQKVGETSSIAKSHGEENDQLVGVIGLRLMF